MRTVIPLILELAVIPLILVFGQDPPSKRTSQFRTLGFGAGTEATVDASGNVKFYELPHRAGDDSSALEASLYEREPPYGAPADGARGGASARELREHRASYLPRHFPDAPRYGIPQPAPAPGDRRRAAAPRASALELLAAAREMQGRGVAMRQQIDLGGDSSTALIQEQQRMMPGMDGAMGGAAGMGMVMLITKLKGPAAGEAAMLAISQMLTGRTPTVKGDYDYMCMCQPAYVVEYPDDPNGPVGTYVNPKNLKPVCIDDATAQQCYIARFNKNSKSKEELLKEFEDNQNNNASGPAMGTGG